MYKVYRNVLPIITFLALFLGHSFTYATVDLELTQGITAALPLAVLDFAGDKPLAAGSEAIDQIIRNDLENSGQFRIISQGSPTQTRTNQVDVSYWRSQKIDNVVTGQITQASNGQYQVQFNLVNVFGNAANTTQLLNQTFAVPQQELRGLAHHIADLIYEKLTGVRGIFSTRIAYILVQRDPQEPDIARYSLEVSDQDGFNPNVLLTSSEPIMSPTWSPDARQIAYVSFEGHRAAVYLQDLANGARHVISSVPGINNAPSFSPDGKKMALVLTKTDNPKIYVMDLATQALTPITDGWSIDTEPMWSADSKSLLFTSDRGGSPQIYQYNFATRQIQRLTYTGQYNAHSAFTPDGKSIIMMHGESNSFGIARQDIESGQLQILVQAGKDESPSLSPNGKMVVYGTEYSGKEVLAQVSTDGRVKVRLPIQNGEVREPAWSPFL